MFKKGDKTPKPAPKGNTRAAKHSLHTYRRMLSGDSIDRRTSLNRILREKEQELASALGGDPSPQEKPVAMKNRVGVVRFFELMETA